MTKEAGPARPAPDAGWRQAWPGTHGTLAMGDNVRKVRESRWNGRVAGWHATELTPEGHAVASSTERGCVRIYPASALERAI